MLSGAQIEQFIRDGFVRIEGAFPRSVADQARAILWRDLDCNPDDPTTQTKPVIRLGLYGDAPFVTAANTPLLHKAFDQLVGRGRWLPRMNPGTFPVRFPSPEDPGDAGWHIDPSFGAENPDMLKRDVGDYQDVNEPSTFPIHAWRKARAGPSRSHRISWGIRSGRQSSTQFSPYLKRAKRGKSACFLVRRRPLPPSLAARASARGLWRDSLRLQNDLARTRLGDDGLAEPKLALRSVASEGWLAVRDDFRNWLVRGSGNGAVSVCGSIDAPDA